MASFVHLHVHSEFSMLDGACRIGEIPARAKENGQTAIALTDHGVMFGTLPFYLACLEQGIKPILGCEVYVAKDTRFGRSGGHTSYDHLVLLCENNTGYQNLLKLVSAGYTEGFYGKPRIDEELLEKYHTGLIGLSACLSGRIPKMLSSGDFEGACAVAGRYGKLFGNDRFYIEIQNHGLTEEQQILPQLVRLADFCGLPLVATNDCHYLHRNDAEAQNVLLCIQTNTTVDEKKTFGLGTDEFYVKNSEEMAMLFAEHPQAIDNTVRIAERCNVTLTLEKAELPHFPTPRGFSAYEYLSQLTFEGFEERVRKGRIVFSDVHPRKEYEDRLSYELSVIDGMGYCDYFLIVREYVTFAKQQGIAVGPGRGSGAGSLVAFAVGITEVDSIRFELLFERFLNPERVSMPDFDIDFCDDRREEVIRHMIELYGQDHVSQIATFGTLAARAAVRDVGRALGMPYADVDRIAKMIPQDHGITIGSALALPDLKRTVATDPGAKRLLETAMKLEGMPRNLSVHAAGILLTAQPITEYVPLAVSGGTVVSQYDMDAIARIGLLKFDFLGLKYLSVIRDAVTQIRESVPDFSIDTIPLDDRAVYDLISKGRTAGLFQLESAGIRDMLMDLKPDCIDEIQAAIALYRPGPMESIPNYLSGRKHPETIRYALPVLEPILSSTYGCVVYQEQVMAICRAVAGYTYGHADIVRRAMAKKKASALQAEEEQFLSGADANGYDRQIAGKLFDDLQSFANYAFNKSHAAAYGIITYQTAYLKVHYPKEFMASLLTSSLTVQGKIVRYIEECGKMGIAVLPPGINTSHAWFHVSGDNIRFGLSALKGIGAGFVERLERERANAPFSSFEDFVQRMTGNDLNKHVAETLIKAGAFDEFGRPRSQLLAKYESIMDACSEKAGRNLAGQLDFFSAHPNGTDVMSHSDYPDIPEMSLKEKLYYEKEVSGMYFSGHLLDNYSSHIQSMEERLTSVIDIVETLGDTEGIKDGSTVTMCGIIKKITVKTTKKDEKMAFVDIEDKTGTVECILFPAVFARVISFLQDDAAVWFSGRLNVREDESGKVVVNEMNRLVENRQFDARAPQRPTNDTNVAQAITRPHRLVIRVPDTEGVLYKKAINLAGIFEGTLPLYVFDSSTKKYAENVAGIDGTDFVIRQYVALLGKENVVLQ